MTSAHAVESLASQPCAKIEDQLTYSIHNSKNFSAFKEYNYQLLEFLGDAILKFATSIAALVGSLQENKEAETTFFAFTKSPGLMTDWVSSFVSNEYFAKVFRNKLLFRYLSASPFAPRKALINHRSQLIGSKTEADVIEALVAAAYLSNIDTMTLVDSHDLPNISM